MLKSVVHGYCERNTLRVIALLYTTLPEGWYVLCYSPVWMHLVPVCKSPGNIVDPNIFVIGNQPPYTGLDAICKTRYFVQLYTKYWHLPIVSASSEECEVL